MSGEPKLAPDAPLITCGDCINGKIDCAECDGTGRLAYRCPGYPAQEDACDHCNGQQAFDCKTCEGQGSYPDPDAVLECEICGEFISESGACMRYGCPYVWVEAA